MLDRWKDETVCIVASGPSLTRADCDYARLAARRVIVINRSWTMCKNADVLYGADLAWWRSDEAPAPGEWDGEKWISARNAFAEYPDFPADIHHVKTRPGAELTKNEPLSEGSNSAFQCLMLAYMWGARKVVFLGLDLALGPNGEVHHHGKHKGVLSNPQPQTLAAFADAFRTVAPSIKAAGVEVINASRGGTFDAFPRKPITEALP